MSNKNVYDVLLERGYIEQVTHEDEVRQYLTQKGGENFLSIKCQDDRQYENQITKVKLLRAQGGCLGTKSR